MKQIHLFFNTIIVIGVCLLPVSCAGTNTDALKNLPPIKITGKYKDKPISVTIYPDGSKPTEVEIDGEIGQPIEIEL